MSVVGDIASRVREFMSTDRDSRILNRARGVHSPYGLAGVSDLLQTYNRDLVREYLRIDYDLMARYLDYEYMDDYPMISTGHNIIASDATQVDVSKGHVAWIEANDKDVQTLLNDFLHRVIRVDEKLPGIARETSSYGNFFGEVTLDHDGVIDWRGLPPPTMRKVEGPNSEIHGYVQDFRRRDGFSVPEFYQVVKEFQANGGRPGELPSTVMGLGQAVPFEPWQITHIKMPSKWSRSVYGYCLVGESRVWGAKGYTPIKDVEVGDLVYCRHRGKLRLTPVLERVCSGVKAVYRLSTKHRELKLTAEHPVLVWRGGKNNAWVQVKDLKPDDRICIAAMQPETAPPVPLGIRYEVMTEGSEVRLTERGRAVLLAQRKVLKYSPKSAGLNAVARTLGLKKHRVETLVNKGQGTVPLKDLRRLFAGLRLPLFEGAYILDTDPRLRLPDTVTPVFARLFGFLLGDGWVSDEAVSYARGTDQPQNDFYDEMLRGLGLEVGVRCDEEGVDRSSVACSKGLAQALRDLGWIDGAHNKRVPSWLFSASRELREAFLTGFVDADGWTTREGAYFHIELCNEPLVRDIKNLVDGLGWTSGRVRRRDPRTSEYKGKKIQSSAGWLLYFRKALLSGGDEFLFEKVESIEPKGEEDVYDICVEDDGHNFVAEGVLVHNSQAETARWAWKRLVLLEDSAMLFRIQRTPERLAFYIDVTGKPAKEAMKMLQWAKQMYKKKRVINSKTNQIELRMDMLAPDEDFFVPTQNGRQGSRIEVLNSPAWQCLVGDTPIPLLDGTTKTIKEMSDLGGEFEVYACTEDGRVVPGRAYAPRMTKASAQIWEVTLDNGETVRCTHNHPFLTRDGRWVLAENLKSGDSLMPLYRRISSRGDGDVLSGFEKVYDPASGLEAYTNCLGDGVVRSSGAPRGERRRVVVSVRCTEDYEPVYDLTVEGHHCFAVGQGVFVHNSMDDLNYFRTMLVMSMQVPRMYLGLDDMSSGSGVQTAPSSADVRFARTVLGLQTMLKGGIAQLCRVHLAALGIPPEAAQFKVKMSTPSAIFELAQIEVLNARADLAQRMGDHVSLPYTLRHVYGLADADIEIILKEREGDMIRDAKAQAAAAKASGGAGGGMFGSVNRPNGPPMWENHWGKSPLSRQMLDALARENRRGSSLNPGILGAMKDRGRFTSDDAFRMNRNLMASQQQTLAHLNEMRGVLRGLAEARR